MQSKDLDARKISMIEAIPMHEGMKSVLMKLLLAEN